jgi:hypothetical protein
MIRRGGAAASIAAPIGCHTFRTRRNDVSSRTADRSRVELRSGRFDLPFGRASAEA